MHMLKAFTSTMLTLTLIFSCSASASNDPVAADPNTGASFNRYAYANNNPYKYIDPDGRESTFMLNRMIERDMRAPTVMDHGEGLISVLTGTDAGYVAPSGSGAVQSVVTPIEVGGASGLVRGAGALARTGSDSAKTITRYMGPGEAAAAARSGAIPNVGKDGIPRPTHVTTDRPVSSASEAMAKYELPVAPTHSATVPGNRVTDLGKTPDGRALTSGGGSQRATQQPIPVKPDEIRKLGR